MILFIASYAPVVNPTGRTSALNEHANLGLVRIEFNFEGAMHVLKY